MIATIVRVAIIGGTSFLNCAQDLLRIQSTDRRVIETPFGSVAVSVPSHSNVVFVQRHETSPDGAYSPPHRINHQALFYALKYDLNVTSVIGLGSVGSLATRIETGQLIVPDDYFSPYNILSMANDATAHFVPGFDDRLRQQLFNALKSYATTVVIHETGTYLQSRGPRFETKAEIRAMARDGDVVGMTCAHEATLAQELHMSYALVCTVDNYAHGLVPNDTLTMGSFRQATKSHLPIAEMALRAAINALQVTV